MKSNSIVRIRILSLGIFLFAAILISKLYYVQVMNGNAYRDRAEKQYINPTQTTFDRGSIFFESKTGTLISAATIKEGYTLFLNTKLLGDKEEAYEKLSEVYPIDRGLFMQKASKVNDPYEELEKKIDAETGQKIANLKIPGVQVFKDNWRYYPGNSMAAQTIGLIGFDKGNHLAGRYGLERYYETTLKRDSSSLYSNFFAEMFSNIQSTLIQGKSPEGDIVATIEPTVENYLENKLNEIEKDWKSDLVGGIIINPNNGEIYAMATLPTFNPNDLSGENNPRVFSNPLVENVYEMGSIIKPITMASGIDMGVVNANTTYDNKNFVELNGKIINNSDKTTHGITTMQEVLNKSLNTGATFVMQQLGMENFSRYFYNFGLGSLTGIDQPNEQRDIVDKSLQSSREVEHATASFGQGIALTPIATVRALSVLANGGHLITPHLVKRIDYKMGISKTIDSEKGQQIIKPETSKEITRMLVVLVDDALKNGRVKLKNYSIAAKTGTAQIADPVQGGYYSDRYLHSFFGYFPASNPQFLVFLFHVYPKGAEFASETLTYPFMDIAKFLINYYEVPPDR